jgi:predicted ATPase/class 3 adenylate cyclase
MRQLHPYARAVARLRTVTLLFTDIEGSTVLVRRLGEDWAGVLERHRDLVRQAVVDHDGVEVGTEGDGFFVVFDDARRAAACATVIHELLAGQDWPAGAELLVRIGIHTGSAEQRDGDWLGLDVHKAARIGAAAHGGQTLISEATRHLLDEDSWLVDLGEHRLKDLPGSVRLYQLGDGRGRAFPPPRTLGGRTVRLPPQWAPLVGRDRETSQLLQLVEDGHRLITLSGPAGVGKTSLALQVAHRWVERCDDSVVMVPLAAVESASEVIPAIARALDAGSPTYDHIAAAVGNRSLLLVLDNLEQVRAVGADIVSLLEAMPGLRALATSQAPLRVPGEKLVVLEPLQLPRTDRLQEVSSAPAVALFCERARALDPRFALTNDNAAAVAAVCRQLDGNPLALELAAARCRSLTPGQLLKRLSDPLSVLVARNAGSDRHASLQSALERTWDLLPEGTRLVASGLGVFEGGWTLELAEQVTAETLPEAQGVDVAWAIDDLVDMSVVRRDADDMTRLTWPTALRDLARGRLAADAELELRWCVAHAKVFLRRCEEVADDPDPDEASWAADGANVWRALEWAQRHDTDLHARLVAVSYGPLRDRLTELDGHLADALACTNDPLTRARLLTLAGLVAARDGNPLSGLAWLEESDAMWAQADRPVERADTFVTRAMMLAQIDHTDARADGWLDEAESLFAHNAPSRTKDVVFGRAQLMVARHDTDGARAALAQLRTLAQGRVLTGYEATVHAHLSADCALLTGDYDSALSGYGEALRLSLQRVYLHQCSTEMQGIAMALGGMGRLAEALRVLGAAERVRDDIGDRMTVAWWSRLLEDFVVRPSETSLDEAARLAARSSGYELGLDAAVALALEAAPSG